MKRTYVGSTIYPSTGEAPLGKRNVWDYFHFRRICVQYFELKGLF
jgi:hypothetical protein